MSANPVALGAPRVHLRRVDSTNLRARELATAGAPHGTLVTAGEQTAGRGRQGRSWSAPAGTALLISLVLRDPPALLALRAGVAVAEVAEALSGREVTVKWPNDVLLEGGKVAGILVESRPQEGWAVLGVGLNVAVALEQLPPDVRGHAATLGRTPADVEPALDRLLAALGRTHAAPLEDVLSALRERDALRHQTVTWTGGTGVADGIDDEGRLLVRTDAQTVALDAGEIHLTSHGST